MILVWGSLYAQTLLVDFSTVKGEFPAILKIRPYRLKLVLYTASILIFPLSLKWGEIIGQFVRFLLLLLRSKNVFPR